MVWLPRLLALELGYPSSTIRGYLFTANQSFAISTHRPIKEIQKGKFYIETTKMISIINKHSSRIFGQIFVKKQVVIET